MRLPLCLGVHVWTGHNCRLCCQEKGWLGVPVFSICPHFFFFLLSKITKMENNRRPSFPLWPWQRALLRLSDFKSSLPDLSRGAKASSFLAQSFLLKYFLWFDLVGWRAAVLFCVNQTQHKVICQKLCINLTDASCTSSQCYVPWFQALFWSNSVYLCLWGIMMFLTKENKL